MNDPLNQRLLLQRRQIVLSAWLGILGLVVSAVALVARLGQPHETTAPEETTEISVYSSIAPSPPLRLKVSYTPSISMGDDAMLTFNTRMDGNRGQDGYLPVEWTVAVESTSFTTAPKTPLTFAWATIIALKPADIGSKQILLRVSTHVASLRQDGRRQQDDAKGEATIPINVSSRPTILGISESTLGTIQAIATIVGLPGLVLLLFQTNRKKQQ